jgi:Arc/MetJ-type ribon-helix-helix transcriptional regulator
MERAISIRLNEEAQEALRSFTTSGRSRSEAVREALVELAARRRGADLAAEAERLSANPDDRAEKAVIAEPMESMR